MSKKNGSENEIEGLELMEQVVFVQVHLSEERKENNGGKSTLDYTHPSSSEVCYIQGLLDGVAET